MSRPQPGAEALRGGIRKRTRAALDRVDRRILEVLRDDGRISVAALAARVDVSRANAYARLDHLRAEGVVEGFSARIDSHAAGLELTAIILLACHQPDWRLLAERLRAMEEIEFCALVTGEYDAFILVRVPDVDTLRDVILERIQAIPGVRGTQTLFVLDEVLRRPYVLP